MLKCEMIMWLIGCDDFADKVVELAGACSEQICSKRYLSLIPASWLCSLPSQHPVSQLCYVLFSMTLLLLAHWYWFVGTYEDAYTQEATRKYFNGIALMLNLIWYMQLYKNRPFRRVLTGAHLTVNGWNEHFIWNNQTRPMKLPLFSYFFYYNWIG